LRAAAQPVRGPLFAFGVAAACVATAFAGLWLMERQWRASPAIAVFLIAIVASAWLSGARAAGIALGLSILGYGLFIVTAAAPVQEGRHAVRLASLVLVAVYIVWLTQTNLARTRAAQQASEALRLAIDTIPTMAWSLLPDGRIDFINRRWLDYCGMNLDQGLRDANTIIHPDERERVAAEWARHIANGEPYEAEMRLRRWDGDDRWFLVRTVPLKDAGGKIAKWYGTSTDIHALKLAEQAVHDSRRLLESMLQTLPVGVAVMNPDSDFVQVNEMSRRIWGDTVVSGDRRLEISRGYWHGTADAVGREDWAGQQALREGRTVHKQLIDIDSFDGQRKTIQNSAAPIRNAEGKVIGAVVVMEDVTARVAADKALHESENLLHHLSRRLFAVQEEERRHLARELHDEFGQLLTAVSLRLQIAKGRAGEAAGPALEECVALIQRAGERVRGLALDLHPTMLETAGLDGTLRWLAESHSRQGPVAVSVSGQVGRLPDDVGVTAFRVVQEALTNVLRHSGATSARIELQQQPGRLRVSVADDGAGFDVGATRAKAAGEGHLGLVSMRERVEIVGGELEIDSRPGAGTRVNVVLPL
jgi:PAS domain S-box-containing protein